MKNKPIHEIRLGAIKAAVWRNDTDAGVRYNATFSRLFKQGDTWQSSDSFGRDDLLLLGKVADQVHSWILEHQSQAPVAPAAQPAAKPVPPMQNSAAKPVAAGA
ncbi:MAG: hypothetical protein KGS61_11865 [Verrucomicrobia bacterium]|nr:hypothetical protein [Verrucomicrobiota bacterium]